MDWIISSINEKEYPAEVKGLLQMK